MSGLKSKLVLIALAAFVGGPIFPIQANACGSMPFQIYLELGADRLKSAALSKAERHEAQAALELARNGFGPKWLGERQVALNRALQLLGLPIAYKAPVFELDEQERQEQLRREAQSLLPEIDELVVERHLDSRHATEVASLRAQTANLVSAAKWAEAIQTGNLALAQLGVLWPKC